MYTSSRYNEENYRRSYTPGFTLCVFIVLGLVVNLILFSVILTPHDFPCASPEEALEACAGDTVLDSTEHVYLLRSDTGELRLAVVEQSAFQERYRLADVQPAQTGAVVVLGYTGAATVTVSDSWTLTASWFSSPFFNCSPLVLAFSLLLLAVEVLLGLLIWRLRRGG